MNAKESGASASVEGWRKRLREAVGDALVDVRCAPLYDGFDFLLVHRPGKRDEAIAQFIDALRGDDMPGYEIRTVEKERAAQRPAEFRDYVAV